MKQVTITDLIKPDREVIKFGEEDRGSAELAEAWDKAKRWDTDLDLVLDTYRQFSEGQLAELSTALRQWSDARRHHNPQDYDALLRKLASTRKVFTTLSKLERRRSMRRWRHAILAGIELGIAASEAKIRPHVEPKLLSGRTREIRAGRAGAMARRKKSEQHDKKFRLLYQARVNELMTGAHPLKYTPACVQTAKEFREKYSSKMHNLKRVMYLTKNET